MTTSATTGADALLGVYRQAGPVFVAGEGSHLIAEDGTRYLDFTAGIAVNALGYGDPDFNAAVRDALDAGVVHTSNLFRTAPAAELASWLVEHSFADRVFFCNSGAEANEGAFKFARRWARERGGAEKHEIIAFRGSFHGRTFGALAATDRPSYQEPFQPLMPGVRFCDVGDLDQLRSTIDRARTAAIIIEPLQAEGGVLPLPEGFLTRVRELCDEHEVALIFDEVQVGLGRTGTLWAHEGPGVEPDLMTIAKPLAGGLPMGGVLLKEHIAAAVQAGDHATTFGGGPLVASAALAVCRKVGSPAFLEEVRRKGELLGERLGALALRKPNVVAVRGVGLIWGIEVKVPAGDIVTAGLQAGLLLVGAGANVVRLVPPLSIDESDLVRGLAILEDLL